MVQVSIDIWICYSHFIRRRFTPSFFSHVCPHDVDFNSTRHTGHKKKLLFGWLCLDTLSMVDKVRFFLFFCDDNLLPEVFIVLCSIFRHCTTYIFLYKIELSTFRHCQKFSSSLFVGCHGHTAAKSRSETKHSIFMVQVRLSSGERGTLVGWGKWADIKSRNSCCLSIFGCDVEAKTFIHLSSSIFFFTLFFLRWEEDFSIESLERSQTSCQGNEFFRNNSIVTNEHLRPFFLGFRSFGRRLCCWCFTFFTSPLSSFLAYLQIQKTIQS